MKACLALKYMATHLREAQPNVSVPLWVVKAKLELFSLVGVQVARLESLSLAAGRDGAVVVMVVEHVQRLGSRRTQVEGDSKLLNILGFLEVVRDAATVALIRAVEDVTLARPARVGPNIVVPGVFGYATFRDAATPGRPRVIAIRLGVDPGPLARVDEGCHVNRVRRRNRRCVLNVIRFRVYFKHFAAACIFIMCTTERDRLYLGISFRMTFELLTNTRYPINLLNISGTHVRTYMAISAIIIVNIYWAFLASKINPL